MQLRDSPDHQLEAEAELTDATILKQRGYFWWHNDPVPNGQFAPSSAVPGLLQVSEDGRISLELDGVLPNERGPLAFLDKNSDLTEKFIQGVLKDTSEVCLLAELHRSGGHFSSNGISFERFRALKCLIGTQPFPSDLKSLTFCELMVELNGYEEWLGLTSIKVSRQKNNISAKYKKPRDAQYRLDDGNLAVHFRISGPPFSTDTDSLSLKESALLTYSPKKHLTLEEARLRYGLLVDFFILLTDSDYRLDWPALSFGKNKGTYKYYFASVLNPAKAPQWYECVANFPEIRECFGQIFSNWKNKRESFGPGFYLYLGTRRGMKLYAEHRFVNLIWGLESIHRRSHIGALETEKILSKITRIISQIERKKDREWLNRQLQHSAEPNLGQRIFEVLKRIPINLKDEKLRDFSSSCAARRNDISHFGGQRDGSDYSAFIQELDLKATALSCLYHLLLLHEIGVDPQILNAWVYKGTKSFVVKSIFVRAGLLDRENLKESAVPSEGKN